MATTKTATLIGATGLIGSHLLSLLQQDNDYHTIRLLVRRPFPINHPKVEVKLINFEDEESFKLGIYGSGVVFCAIGTTQQKVKGDKTAYRKVDYDIPVKASRFCKETGCEQLVLVSSVGASTKASNFYLQLKGEVEEAVKAQSLESVSIFRPSLLLGERSEKRTGEKIAQAIMPVFSFALGGPWSKYKPIQALDVAKAMMQAVKQKNQGFAIYEYKQMRSLAQAYQ
jgi:uncharacterized protein YbjT (DUF2867 family)